MTDIAIYKERTHVRCLRDGYGFLSHNLWLITKKMWAYMLTVAVLLTAMNFINVHINIAVMTNEEVTMSEVIISLCVDIAALAAYILSIKKIFILHSRLANTPYLYKGLAKKCLKNFFKILGTMILSLVIQALLCAIIILPMIAVDNAYLTSIEGKYNFGDTALIPTYGYILIAAVCIVCYFLTRIVAVGNWTTLILLYGNMYAKDKICHKPNKQLN